MTKKVTRKQFIKTSGALALGGATVLSACQPGATSAVNDSASFDKKYTWNMVTTWPPNFPILDEGCRIFARLVEEMSGGRLQIRVYGGGELIPALEAFDAVSSGTAELGSGAAYYWAGKSLATQFFAAIPFGLNAQQMQSWLLDGGMQLWEEVYAPFNVIPLVGGNTGVQMGGWFNREINSTADLRGLKMRMPGLGGKVLNKAGGTAVLVSGAEIFTNLERGVIDAAEWIGPYHDYLMGFHQIAKYYYYPGWHEPGTILELFVNKLKFERLPLHLQEIIRSAAARVSSWMLPEFEIKNAEYLARIREESNVEIRKFPTEVLQSLRRISKEVIMELAAKDPMSKKINNSLEAFRKKIKPWSEISEEIYHSTL